MSAILGKAGCFIAIILLGWYLRKIGVFHESDFRILSTIVLKITLPAAIVSSCAGKQIDPGMLVLSLLGFGFGCVYVLTGFVLGRKQGKETQAFYMVNLSGYNIGNFTMPFVQSFLGSVGVLTTSLFDVGNAVICLGAAYGMAVMVKDGERFSFSRIGKVLSHSVPFIAHVTMATLALMHWNLPTIVTDFAGIIAGANPFLAMLMLGVGFHISGDRSQIWEITEALALRFGLAVLFSLLCYFALPLAEEYRVALAVLCFAPISSAMPAFTAELKSDVGLSSAINSISIVIGLVCMVVLLLILL